MTRVRDLASSHRLPCRNSLFENFSRLGGRLSFGRERRFRAIVDLRRFEKRPVKPTLSEGVRLHSYAELVIFGHAALCDIVGERTSPKFRRRTLGQSHGAVPRPRRLDRGPLHGGQRSRQAALRRSLSHSGGGARRIPCNRSDLAVGRRQRERHSRVTAATSLGYSETENGQG